MKKQCKIDGYADQHQLNKATATLTVAFSISATLPQIIIKFSWPCLSIYISLCSIYWQSKTYLISCKQKKNFLSPTNFMQSQIPSNTQWGDRTHMMRYLYLVDEFRRTVEITTSIKKITQSSWDKFTAEYEVNFVTYASKVQMFCI